MLTKLRETIDQFNRMPCKTSEDKRKAKEFFLKTLNDWLTKEPSYMIEIVKAQIQVELCAYHSHPAIVQALSMLDGMVILRSIKPDILKEYNEHDEHYV